MSTRKPEVLSPVGNRRMLEAAVRAGADAVYLGMSDFNARRNAENFDREAFREAVEYCHVRGVRLYLTLNTLVSDEELDLALKTAEFAYRCGADAVIVQDLGLMYELHRQLPAFPIHASTQMTVHSEAALDLLQTLGVTQVVLSREMSREEIAAFCVEAKKRNILVEVFVHGALCMCMSGQCYLSALLGGRSGNRGLCAGPCRLPFSGRALSDDYHLSLKDLSLVDYLNELSLLGVSSFKIEGRMKRPEYVAAATAVCRKVLDGDECEEWKRALCDVFSRSGFTDGYYTSKRDEKMFGVRGKEDVLLSGAVLKKLHELYRAERQSVSLTGEFVCEKGSPVRLIYRDGTHFVEVEGDFPEAAQGQALTEDAVMALISRTGNTPYRVESIRCRISEGVFYPASRINELRREAIEKLNVLRKAPVEVQKSAVSYVPHCTKKSAFGMKFVGRFANIGQLPEKLSDFSTVIIPLEEKWETITTDVPLCVEIPRGISNETVLMSRLNEAAQKGIEWAYCSNLSAVTLSRRAGLKPMFGFGMNLFSSAALECAKELGSQSCVLSFESKVQAINAMSSQLECGIFGYGRLPLMLMRNCPLHNLHSCKNCKGGALKDRKGKEFPIVCRMGYSELLNSEPVWIADKLDQFRVDFCLLYFTTESPQMCADILRKYREKMKPNTNFTRGLYFRGVE